MSEANTGTYDVHDRRVLTSGMAMQAAFPTPKLSVHRAYPFNADSVEPFPAAESAWQVREDKAFYIPDILFDNRYDPQPEQHAAADEHARHLRKAQGYLDDAFNLVGVLLASFGDDGDSRTMRAETVLKIVERKLNKALNRIDRHDRRHTNLFFAYFDLRDKAEAEKGSDE
jgi:hypothetical protein